MPSSYQLEPIDESDLGAEKKVAAVPEVKLTSPISETPKMETEQLKEVVAAEKDAAYGKILSQVQTQAPSQTGDADVKTDADAVFQKTDAESQIQHLVGVAAQKGVMHAVKVARHLEDNYVLDSFHDKLMAEELHDALLKKGFLKEI